MLQTVKPFIEFYRLAAFTPSTPPDRSIRRLWRSLAQGWRATRRYRQLELMSDEELSRLGLDRASIARHAFFGEPPFGRG